MTYRNQMIAKIQIEFPKLRRDLDGGELRAARLEFYRETLGLQRAPKSTTSLTDSQLGRVLDAITALGGQKPEASGQKSEVRGQGSTSPLSLTSCTVRPLKKINLVQVERELRPAKAKEIGLSAVAATDEAVSCGVPALTSDLRPPTSSEVIHLAGNEQAWACARVMDHLEWPAEKRQEYISKRFHRTSEKLLSPTVAGNLLFQLLLIAAHVELKARLGRDVPLTMDQKKAEIPAVKRMLGIDQGAK